MFLLLLGAQHRYPTSINFAVDTFDSQSATPAVECHQGIYQKSLLTQRNELHKSYCLFIYLPRLFHGALLDIDLRIV